METVCQVAFALMNRDEARRAEAILREYLMRVSDQVSMTREDGSWLSLLSFIPHPIRMNRFLAKLKDGDVVYKDERQMTFALTDNIRNLLNQTTLFLFDSGRFFYRLTDPKFLKQGKEVAKMIVSDRILMLHIPDSDKAMLSDQGVYVDSPQI